MRTLVSACLLLLLAACGVQPQQPPAQMVTQGPPEFVCQPGAHVPDPDVLKDTLRVSFFAAQNSLAVLPFIDGGNIVGDYSIPLLKAVKAGQVQHWSGHGTVRVAIHSPNGAAMPRRVAYVAGKNICQGMLEVVRVAPRIYAADLPIEGGAKLAYAGLVFPRAAFVTEHQRVWVCAQALDFQLLYTPEITEGPYAHKPRVLCGLPGTQPGTTKLGENARTTFGAIFPLIAGE